MNEVYGAVRVSTGHQNIERQIRNILELYPNAHIVKEIYTGTKLDGMVEFNKLYNYARKSIKFGKHITIVYDSVSRMSRNAEEGFALYEELFNLGVSLIFLKEPHINTDTYKKTLEVDIPLTGSNIDIILSAVKKYLMELAKEQIKIAFNQSQKEVDDLHKRTSEGMRTAALNGKQIGRIKGKRYISKKEIEAKKVIIKNSRYFNGNNTDDEVMRIAGISKNSFYKYKSELKSLYNNV